MDDLTDGERSRYRTDVRFHNLVHYILSATDSGQVSLADFKSAVAVAEALSEPRTARREPAISSSEDPRRV